MAGTKIGAAKAKETNIARYGSGYYKRIGAIGGRVGTHKGFASEEVGSDGLTGRQRASKVGAIGGAKSRRSGSASDRIFKKNRDNAVESLGHAIESLSIAYATLYAKNNNGAIDQCADRVAQNVSVAIHELADKAVEVFFSHKENK